MDKNRGISVIIPVYNEEEIIVENTTKVVEYLSRNPGRYEVVLSCNGCRDGSVELAKELSKKHPIKVLSARQRGVGLAFRRAIDKASFDKIVSLDMDLTIDMDFIKWADALLNEADVVVGSKIMGVQRRSAFRRWGSLVYLRIASFLLGLPFHDYSPSGKAYRRQVMLKHLDFLSSDVGTSYVVETIYKIFRAGGKIVEMPIDCDDTRKSSFNLVDEAVYRYRHLFTLFLKSRAWAK